MTVNRLILGDNLEILKNMEKESVDLIYLDPPFFSNRNYEVIWGDTGEIRSFQDRWATFGSVGRHKPLLGNDCQLSKSIGKRYTLSRGKRGYCHFG